MKMCLHLLPGAGPMRKIKPISTDIESAQTNPDKQLQVSIAAIYSFTNL